MTPRRLMVFFKLTLLASCHGSTPTPAESETEPSSQDIWETRFAEKGEGDSQTRTTASADGPQNTGLAGAAFFRTPPQYKTKSERREAP